MGFIYQYKEFLIKKSLAIDIKLKQQHVAVYISCILL